ncbi:MAG: UvrD-helicase domain-containing protein [Desulfovibrio sp.]
MASEVISDQDELQQIFEHIGHGRNFLLSGGAGSGKTYTLVQTIKKVIGSNPTSRVACVTYTNAAVREINERVDHPNLHVSTIHEFLWSNIKHFQKELRATLVSLVNDAECPRIKIPSVETVVDDYYDSGEGIRYKEYVRIAEGIISHDELLLVAHKMFESYGVLCGIVKDKYPFIFVDEYQDTQPEVVSILLNLMEHSTKDCVRGFFGDAMQSIYTGRGTILDEFLKNGTVYEVQKKQNRRNPQLVIDLANKIRTDGLIQEPSCDVSAPNMKADGEVKQGSVRFLYSRHSEGAERGLERAKEFLVWDFSDSKHVKELNLTKNLMAKKAGFPTLMEIYDGDKILAYCQRVKNYIKKENNDSEGYSGKTFREVVDLLSPNAGSAVLPTRAMQLYIDTHSDLYEYAMDYDFDKLSKLYVDKEHLLDDKKQDPDDEKKRGSKRDYLIRHLMRLQHNIYLYKTGRYNEFIRLTDYRNKLNSIEDKRALRTIIDTLVETGEKTIEEVVQYASANGICKKDDRLEQFIGSKTYLYNRVKDVSFSEFQSVYDYLEGHTAYSTQHKTKGAEYDNVFVILDNGAWNQYNFSQLFGGTSKGTESVLNRTQKIFYVCCTRAKENLAVYFCNPSEAVLECACEWFGRGNVINVDA